jgi:hypothetical protein
MVHGDSPSAGTGKSPLVAGSLQFVHQNSTREADGTFPVFFSEQDTNKSSRVTLDPLDLVDMDDELISVAVDSIDGAKT